MKKPEPHMPQKGHKQPANHPWNIASRKTVLAKRQKQVDDLLALIGRAMEKNNER